MAQDIAIGNPNVETGAFNFVIGPDGDVQFDETGAHGVVTSVIERQGSYPFDLTHGSNIYQQQSLTSRTPSQVEAEALAACQSMEDADEIQEVSAQAAVDTRAIGRLTLDVSWKSGAGELQTRRIEV